MANTFQWYLCPYDVITRPIGVVRVPAIARYIATVPNVDGSLWDEAETLGNYLVVKVFAPITVHTLIQADADFVAIPSVIPVSSQLTLKNKLVSLGFTAKEVDDTGFDVMLLLTLLTSVRTIFQKNLTNDGLNVLAGRRAAGKTVMDIQARLPG